VAKSASYWRYKELKFFNISISDVEEGPFFGAPLPRYSGLAPGFITHQNRVDGIDEASNSLLKRLEIATMDRTSTGIPKQNPATIKVEETMIDGFGAEILRITGYENNNTVVLLQNKMPFTMSNKTVVAKANTSLYDTTSKMLLLIQENKMITNSSRPAPQLIAGAIAAFQCNNKIRAAMSLPPLEEQLIAGITMWGTSPIFYKIPVSFNLAQSVECGECPKKKTCVSRHVPLLPIAGKADVMSILKNRIHLVRCYIGFRKLVLRL
jgi:hypothetical protein